MAVECTVRYLHPRPTKNVSGLYCDAVNRIWRGRIRLMLEAMAASSSTRICHFITPELILWKDEIFSTLWDEEACKRLANINTRKNALDKVRVYLEEAWTSMNPSNLKSASLLLFDRSALHIAAICMEKATETAIQKGTVLLEENHDGPSTSREAEIIDVGKLGPSLVCCKHHNEYHIEVEKLRKAVASTSLNMQALMKDPVPDEPHESNLVRSKVAGYKHHTQYLIEVEKLEKVVSSSSLKFQALMKGPLHESDIVRSEVAAKGVNHESLVENQGTPVDVPKQNTRVLL